jgi:hypothetical protein
VGGGGGGPRWRLGAGGRSIRGAGGHVLSLGRPPRSCLWPRRGAEASGSLPGQDPSTRLGGHDDADVRRRTIAPRGVAPPLPRRTTTTTRCCCRSPAALSPSCSFLSGPSPAPLLGSVSSFLPPLSPPFPPPPTLSSLPPPASAAVSPSTGGWGWREGAWARCHVRASRRVQAERDDAEFGVVAAERNHPVAFGVARCSPKNAKSDLEVVLPARYRHQCRQSYPFPCREPPCRPMFYPGKSIPAKATAP